MRLTDKGILVGCVSAQRAKIFKNKKYLLETTRNELSAISVSPNEAEKSGVNINKDGIKRSLLDLLAMNNVGIEGVIKICPKFNDINTNIMQLISNEATYSVYLEKQQADIISFRQDENLIIPASFDYSLPNISLSNEARVKLNAAKPHTIGAASRIPGITPAAIAAIMVAIKRCNYKVSA